MFYINPNKHNGFRPFSIVKKILSNCYGLEFRFGVKNYANLFKSLFMQVDNGYWEGGVDMYSGLWKREFCGAKCQP